MLPSFILAVREGLEAALVIGIVIGVLKKIEKSELQPIVWAALFSAILVSLVSALGLNWLDAEFEGLGEVVFEGVSMLTAACLLTWMIFWMGRQARNMRRDMEVDVRRAALQPGKFALFLLTFVSVLKEGIELALFLLAARLTSDPIQTMSGSVLGLVTAGLLGWGLFSTTRRLNLARFFQLTNFLLIIFAAGLVAHGVHAFNEIGWIPALVNPIWDINNILSNQSTLGEFLRALIGYNAAPSLSEALAYIAYFACLVIAIAVGYRHSAATHAHKA